LMHDSTLTTNQPNGNSDRVSSQVTAPATQPARNQSSADSTRPCTSWPRPGTMRLQMAAMTLPAEPGPFAIAELLSWNTSILADRCWPASEEGHAPRAEIPVSTDACPRIANN